MRLIANQVVEKGATQVRYITPDGAEIVVEGAVGESVMQCAKTHGIGGIIGECGGGLACATCHAYLDDAWLSAVTGPSDFERDLLTGCIDVRENSRLTCQIVLRDDLDGLTLILPKSQT